MGSGWQTKLSVSPGPGLWSLVLGPSGPDLGPGPGPELDNNNNESGRSPIGTDSKSGDFCTIFRVSHGSLNTINRLYPSTPYSLIDKPKSKPKGK